MIRQILALFTVTFIQPGDIEALKSGLIHLLQNENLRNQLATAGRRLAETQYNWEPVEPHYLRIYEDLA